MKFCIKWLARINKSSPHKASAMLSIDNALLLLANGKRLMNARLKECDNYMSTYPSLWDVLSCENGAIVKTNIMSGEKKKVADIPIKDYERRFLIGWAEYDSDLFCLDNPTYALYKLSQVVKRCLDDDE